MIGWMLLLLAWVASAADETVTAVGPVEPVVVVLSLDPIPKTDRPECLRTDAPVSCAYRLRFAHHVPGVPNEDRLRTVESRLLVSAFDDIARGYEMPMSPAGQLLRETWGPDAFPPTDELWTTGASAAARQTSDGRTPVRVLRIHSKPGSGADRVEIGPSHPVHLDPCEHQIIGSTAPDGIWKRLRYQLPCTRDPLTGERTDKAVAPSSIVLLTGRFAERMAADERPLPVDIMGTDLDSGAAFLEEMFPVSRASWKAGVRTLEAFQGAPRDTLATSCREIGDQPFPVRLLTNTDRACLERVASRHMRRFEEDTFHQIQRFAIPTAPPLAPRVLGALGAMSAPPGAIPDLQPISFEQLVSSSRGQLDPEELRARPSIEPIASAALAIHYGALPPFVLWEGLAEVVQYTHGGTEAPIRSVLGDNRTALFGAPNRRVQAGDPPPLGRAEAAAWIRTSGIAPSRQPDAFAAYPAAALQYVVEQSGLLSGRSQDRFREWLLYQHLRHEMYPLRSPDPSVEVTAGDIEQATMGILAAVAATHGVPIAPVDQSAPGTVDPLAVCTTTDGEDSLAEPMQAVVTIDQIFAVPAHGELVKDPLWAVRGELPFVAMDDPTRTVGGRRLNAPTIEKILELPGNVGVFRARWTVWAGWHLLWNVEDHDGIDHVVGRTAAICEDTVLVPEPLLPNLLWEVLGAGSEDLPDQDSDATRLREQSLSWLAPIIQAPLRELSGSGGATVAVVVEKNYTDDPTRSFFQAPVGPASLDRVRARDGRHRFVEGWAVATVLAADSEVPAVSISPAHILRSPTPPIPSIGADPKAASALKATPAPAPAEEVELPERWTRSTATEPWLDVGLLAYGYDASAGRLTRAPALNVNTGLTIWRLGLPTRGITMGLGGNLTSIPGDKPPELSTDTSVGMRFAPLPSAARRPARRAVAWGGEQPGGGREVGRTQFGGRVGWQLAGDDTEGFVHSFWVEPWWARSIHPAFSSRGNLNPYSPGLLLGPSVRLQVEPDFASSSVDAISLSVALRTWWLMPRRAGGKK